MCDALGRRTIRLVKSSNQELGSGIPDPVDADSNSHRRGERVMGLSCRRQQAQGGGLSRQTKQRILLQTSGRLCIVSICQRTQRTELRAEHDDWDRARLSMGIPALLSFDTGMAECQK